MDTGLYGLVRACFSSRPAAAVAVGEMAEYGIWAADCGGLGLKAGQSVDLESALKEAIVSSRPSLELGGSRHNTSS
ncbi:MAG TPA: hypothetical protein DCZ10_13460 [Pelotomaculum sp.]|nr:hypothetical protein [Pelotomaculum sp.]